eukprot:1194477-Prorocentrum_minimum.AAC.2
MNNNDEESNHGVYTSRYSLPSLHARKGAAAHYRRLGAVALSVTHWSHRACQRTRKCYTLVTPSMPAHAQLARQGSILTVQVVCLVKPPGRST